MSTLLEIHAVTGAVVDTQFTNALTHRLNITWQSMRQTKYTCGDDSPCLLVPKLAFPIPLGGSLFDALHKAFVAYKLHTSKYPQGLPAVKSGSPPIGRSN